MIATARHNPAQYCTIGPSERFYNHLQTEGCQKVQQASGLIGEVVRFRAVVIPPCRLDGLCGARDSGNYNILFVNQAVQHQRTCPCPLLCVVTVGASPLKVRDEQRHHEIGALGARATSTISDT